jgi:hypothetical protein
MASKNDSDVNVTFSASAWITGKLRGDQKKMIIALGELIILISLVGLSAPGGSHCCSSSSVSQNDD